MISASFGSATRHIDLKMTMTEHDDGGDDDADDDHVHARLPPSRYIGVTTTVRGGKYSTTTTRVPVAISSSPSAA